MTTPYDAKYYGQIAEGSRRSALRVLPIVLEMVRPGCVIDVGCGSGAWLGACRQLGVADVVGLDGDYVDRTKLEIPADRFVSADLATITPAALKALGPPVSRRFDLAVSVEVAEHLPEEAAGRFVDTLCAAAPVVLFSAAIPNQGGTNHVNEQFPSYWAEHFARNGMRPVDTVRRAVWGDPQVEWWYRQNLLIFASDAAIGAIPELGAARRCTSDQALDVIHPVQYARVIQWVHEWWQKAQAKG